MDMKNIKLVVIIILWISAIVFFASTVMQKPVAVQNVTIDHYVSERNDIKRERKKCQDEKLEIEDQLRKKNAPVKKC